MRTSSIRIILQLSIVINNMIPHDKIFLSSFHTDSLAPEATWLQGLKARSTSRPPGGGAKAPPFRAPWMITIANAGRR